MPLYEYKCLKCGRRTEKIESVSGPHLKKCPHCGGKVEALISAPAIQFKGSGWYVTDYAGKSGGDKSEKGKDDDKPASDKASTEKDKKDSSAKDSDSKASTAKETAGEKKSEKPAKKK